MNLDQFRLLLNTSNYISASTIIIYLMVTLLLTSMLFIVYKITFTGVAYSNNFNISIVLTGMITSMIMMVIGNNLALSLGMVGALSIVRFRAAIKEPKDISYLFLTIAIGLAVGTGALKIAIIGTVFIIITMLMYRVLPVFKNQSYLLIIKGGKYDTDQINHILKTDLKSYKLRMKNTKVDRIESIFEVQIKKDEDKLIDNLYQVEFVETVNLITFDGQLNE